MQPYCSIHNTAFDKVLEMHHEAASADFMEYVDLDITDSPYNTCREANCDNLDNEFLNS